jgi:hypothetical protein
MLREDSGLLYILFGTRWRIVRGTAEGRGFYSRRGHRLDPSSRTMDPGSIQPLTEMSTKDIFRG